MFFKNLMKWMLLLTIIISFSSNFWFILWLMMEMNLLMFIPIMNEKKKINSNCMISYFIIQSFSSSLFLISAINFFILDYKFFEFMMMISILIKLAMIPFHFWLSNLSEMFNYESLFLILTIQKMIPLYILNIIKLNSIIIFIILSSLMSSLFLMNLKMIKKIIIFSSISHQSWMISLIYLKSNFWMSYLLIYLLLIFKITMILKKNKINHIYNFMKMNSNFLKKVSIYTMMLSLGGMPPMLGFIPKLISIMIIMKMNMLIIIILIISSIMNIYIYMRMFNPMLFIFFLNFKKFLKTNLNKNNLFIYLNLMISIFIINILMN
uniref:NADH-ubiquinone oxidoreductase chain 2 n=1 Tax=Amblyomma latum TaxID=34617 RepID=A0A977XW36_9ACAR|nr:NADH dehydrogenase subunit 2 [Amblyomma latum]UXX50159.1 NADH dehydrogenase subunit 2 [Amblyomma latum]